MPLFGISSWGWKRRPSAYRHIVISQALFGPVPLFDVGMEEAAAMVNDFISMMDTPEEMRRYEPQRKN